MANFCGTCGAPDSGTRFCTSCGAERVGAAGTATPAADPTVVAPQVDGFPPPGPAAPQPTRVFPSGGTNPFAGVPISDYLRDAGAVVLLLSALALPWDWNGDASDRWWVVLSLLVALVAVGLPYVVASGVVPGWTRAHVRLGKLLAVVPFLVSLLVVLLNELVNVGNDFEGGVGVGVAVGLAGVLLALQPRHLDEDPALPVDGLWRQGVAVLGFASVVVAVLTFTVALIKLLTDDFLDVGPLAVIALLLGLATYVVVWALPVVMSAGGRRPWLLVLITVGFTILAVATLTGEGDGIFGMQQIEKWDTFLAGTFLIAATTALAVSRPVHRIAPAGDPLDRWVATARAAVSVSAIALVLVAVSYVVTMADRSDVDASGIILVLLMLATALLHVVARARLNDVQRSRPLVLALLGGTLLLGIVAVSVGRSGDQISYLDGYVTAMWFTLPALAAYALLVPAVVRERLGPIVTERSAEAPQQADQAQHHDHREPDQEDPL